MNPSTLAEAGKDAITGKDGRIGMMKLDSLQSMPVEEIIIIVQTMVNR
ncbi:MAG: hypothetical protein ACLRYY_11445 [Anaerobutyricum soehngenii]